MSGSQPHIRRAVDDDGEALSILNAEIQALHAEALAWRRTFANGAFPARIFTKASLICTQDTKVRYMN